MPAEASAPVRWTAPRPDPDQPRADLGALGGTAHHAVCVGHPEIGTYNHLPRLTRRGQLLVMWRNQERDPHAPGQRVLYSRSRDGETWSAPKPLFPSLTRMEPIGGQGVLLSPDRFYRFADRCYAAARAWRIDGWVDESGQARLRRGDYHLHNIPVRKPLPTLLRRLDEDGAPMDRPFWLAESAPAGLDHIPPGTSESKHTLEDVMQILRLDRAARALRFRDAGGAPLRLAAKYERADAAEVALLQDGADAARLLASLRPAGKAEWATPVETDLPDSGGPLDALSLPDGQVLLAGNLVPARDRRSALVLASSPDGVAFDRAWTLRSEAPALRFEGLRKLPGPQAPSFLLDGEEILVAYAINQEDIAFARFAAAAVARHATVAGAADEEEPAAGAGGAEAGA